LPERENRPLTAYMRDDIIMHMGGEKMNVSPKVRTDSVVMRVTPEEKKMLKLQAAALGMTVTSYLLGLALGTIAGGVAASQQEKKG